MTEATKDIDKLDRAKKRKLGMGRTWDAWPDYEAAASGLENYWYPVVWARKVKTKPVPIKLLSLIHI